MTRSTRFRWITTAVLALLFSVSASAHAQNVTITGKVLSDGGQALYGANVVIEALQISVGTTAQGVYTITVPGARARGQIVNMRVRAIGYQPQVMNVQMSPGTQTHNFEMKIDVNRLNQVVVTGVSGATEVKKLAFTVAQVSQADVPVAGSNALSQLQGKVAGANIVSSSGRPGSAPSIILRGPQSINGSGRGQEPLYIIDGVVSQGGLADINPQDIENVEVVKGAAASSMYGSRAGNGVIQITTRSGKNSQDGIKFRVNAEYGTSDIENILDIPQSHVMVMDQDYKRFCIVTSGAPDCTRTVDIYAEAYRINDQGTDFSLPAVNFVNDGGIARNPGQVNLRALYLSNPFPRAGTPIRQLLTNGQTYNNTLDATGRVGRTNFFASANMFRQEGALRFMDGYFRNSIRLNIDQQMAGNWNFGVRTAFSDVVDNNPGFGNQFLRLSRQPANAELLRRDSKGRLFIRSTPQVGGIQNYNAAYFAEFYRPRNRISRFVGALSAKWQPLTWLDASAEFGYDGRSNHQEGQLDRGYRTTASSSANTGSLDWSSGRAFAINGAAMVTARKSWFENSLDSRLTLRGSYEASDDRGMNLGGVQLAVPGLEDPSAVVSGQDIGGFSEQVKALGMFANLDLDYKGRYILGGLVRRDAASLFGAAQRWQTYGRGSFAWRVSEEPWFKVSKISDLKLRISEGTAGNRPRYSAQYETFTIGGGGALNPNTLGNKDLRPEVSREIEAGIDMEIMNKYGITITHANNVINDQLLPVTPPAAAGFGTQWQNAGELTNKTWEVSLNIPIIQQRDLGYSVRFNWDATTSVVTRLDMPETFYSAAGQQGAEQMFKIKQGEDFGSIWGRKFARNCSELPAAFQSKCGAGLDYQKNQDGWLVYIGAGNTPKDGITKNLWFTRLPKDQAPWGMDILQWGGPILVRDSTGAVPLFNIGKALPDFHWSFSQNFNFKKFTAYALLDATVGKSVWNEQRQWSLGDFQMSEVDQNSKSIGDAKPLGYYFRAASTGGIGGLYDLLAPNNNTVEDASFVKLREVSIGYRIGRLPGIGGDWNVSVIGRNLKTWTDYTGYDPEVGVGGGDLGSGALNAIDAFGFPNLRQVAFSFSTSF